MFSLVSGSLRGMSVRSIFALGGGTGKIITIPVIQVVGSVWNLLFVMDAGAEIVSYFALIST